MIRSLAVIMILVLMIPVGCEDNPASDRIRMPGFGFTPFPYAATSEAVTYSYSILNRYANLVMHHFDDGIPWPEALAGDEFHANIVSDWNYRKANTGTAHQVVLSITPISIDRDTLAPYKGEEGDMPLPSPWDTYQFNHPNVKKAYLNYCKRAIDFFEPDYAVIGIEVNLLIAADPTLGKWNRYMELHRETYDSLKTVYPDLPLMVSLTGMDLVAGYTDVDHADQVTGLNDIIDHTDYFGLSMHVILSTFLADSISTEILTNVFELSNKPLAICETSYPADTFTIGSVGVTFNGNPQKQASYFDTLFAALGMRQRAGQEFKFVVNFIIRDYDQLWESLGSPDNITKVWRDTGFFDEDGNPRPVLADWENTIRAHTPQPDRRIPLR